jgi:hypothetical protein
MNIWKKLKFPWYTRWGTTLDEYCGIWIDNPLKTWWKAREYFKRPKMSFMFFNDIYRCCPYASIKNVGKIIDIQIHDVGWKDKWDTPRHERSPYIWICFFKRFGISIGFHIYYHNEFGLIENGDMEYWEYLLKWLYYKEKKTLRCYSHWEMDSKVYRKCVKYGEAEDGSEDVFEPYKVIIPTVAMSLTKKGALALQKEIYANRK